MDAEGGDVAGLYLRVSSARQKGNRSVEDQLALASLGAERGLQVSIYRDDGISGETIEARPDMQRLLADIEAGRLRAVIIQDWTRLSRDEDLIDALLIKRACKDAGVIVLSPGREMDFSREGDNLLAGIEMIVAAGQKQKLVKATTRARYRQFAATGYAGGQVRYGYRLVYDVPHRDGRLRARPAVDDERAAVVRQIYDWYVNGLEINGVWQQPSQRTIAHVLNVAGARFPVSGHAKLRRDGARLQAGTARLWADDDIRRILIGREYSGYWTYGEQRLSKYVRDLGPQEVHKPDLQLVDIATWQRAQRLLQQRATDPGRRNACAPHALVGLLRCPQCDRLMAVNKKSGASPGATVNYRCLTRRRSGASACAGSWVSERLARSLVESLLLDLVEQLRRVPIAAASANNATLQSVEESLAAERADMERQLSRLVDAVAAGALTPAEVRTKKLTLLDKQARIDARLAKLRRHAEGDAERESVLALVRQNPQAVVASMDSGRFRLFAQLFLATMVIDRGVIVRHELTEPFREAVSRNTSAVYVLTETAEVGEPPALLRDVLALLRAA